MATRLEKVKKIFRRFDVDGDGRLDGSELAALVQAVNPRVIFTDEQIEAITDEILRTYGDLLGGNKCLLTLDVLLRTYDDGAGDVDRDFEVLGLSLDDDDGRAASGVSAASAAQPPLSPARPRQRALLRLAGELEGLIRRLPRRHRRIEEAHIRKATERRDDWLQSPSPVSSAEVAGEENGLDDLAVSSGADGDGNGDDASPRASRVWDSKSSLASSYLYSETDDSELDYRDRPMQSECEEIPSFRWLSPSLMPMKPPKHRPVTSEVDWEQLLSLDLQRPSSIPLFQEFAHNHWTVFGLDESSGKRCCVVLSRGLKISWRDDRSSWRYNGVLAVLSDVCWLDVRAEVPAADLSPGTPYVCLLVFKLSTGAFGLGLDGETQKASVSVGRRVKSESAVRLQPARDRRSRGGAREPRRRRDGWMEMELGEFSMSGRRVVVRMALREVEKLDQPKGGLVLLGVEVRPKQFLHAELTKIRPPRKLDRPVVVVDDAR